MGYLRERLCEVSTWVSAVIGAVHFQILPPSKWTDYLVYCLVVVLALKPEGQGPRPA